MNAKINKLETARILSPIEWNMKAYLDSVPDWQLVAMLNYEYARCFEPLLEKVAWLRRYKLPVWNIADRRPTKNRLVNGGFMAPKVQDNTPQSPIFNFAYYLACVFPEFPRVPWVKIPPAVRQSRLAEVNINEETGLYGAECKPGWKAWELGSQDIPPLVRNLSQPSDYLTQQFGVFEINFKHEDQAIIANFSQWLKNRREYLIKIWNRPVEAFDATSGKFIGIAFNQNTYFIPALEPEPERGRGNIKVRCKDLLKDLGWVRIWCHADYNVENVWEAPWPEVTQLEATKESSAIGENSQDPFDYFTESQNIKRAELRVGEIMACLEVAWECDSSFTYSEDVFACQSAAGAKTRYPKGSAAETVRTLLKENFIVSSLNIERVRRTTGATGTDYFLKKNQPH